MNDFDLDDYINYLKKYVQDNSLQEEEFIMMVYLNLGKMFKFDQDFFFGGSKKREEMYYLAPRYSYCNESFKKKKINCKVVSYILKYILENFGINIKVIEALNDERKYKHVLNLIKSSNNEEYTIDLQDDMINIHYHDFTYGFGLSPDGSKYVISPDRQRLMHEKLGYITKDNPYTGEYIYLIKQYVNCFDDFASKVSFVLENIDCVDNSNIDYFERYWRHKRILERIFTEHELTNLLKMVEFYKIQEDGTKKYYNGFFLDIPKNVLIYMYSMEENQYIAYTPDEFAIKIQKENIYYNQNIRGIKGALKRLDNKVLSKSLSDMV